MTDYTPGPWDLTKAKNPDNTGGFDYCISDANHNILAEVFEHVGWGKDTVYMKLPAQINAELIASAPRLKEERDELLVMLVKMTDMASGAIEDQEDSDDVAKARELIAKVEK